jgi:hypothetical protein
VQLLKLSKKTMLINNRKMKKETWTKRKKWRLSFVNFVRSLLLKFSWISTLKDVLKRKKERRKRQPSRRNDPLSIIY